MKKMLQKPRESIQISGYEKRNRKNKKKVCSKERSKQQNITRINI